VQDNVYLACRGVSRGRFSMLRPSHNDALMSATETLIEAVHLAAVKDQHVAELAHGQQRQLEIALALAGAPRFILFDEPAAGLSPTERLELIEILTSLPSHIGYIIIEHDMDVALRVVESVTMMHNGRIFKEGVPEEIESDPEVQELYLGGGHE
jgi:branched-chain amino acid transport system ATP-binding protein